MLIRRRWRRVVVIGVVLVLMVLSARAADNTSPIEYYRVVDDQTLTVGTITGHNAWTRATGVTETPSSVTITVSSFLLGLGGTADGVPAVSEVKLHDPIGGRTVIDGFTGQTVKQCTHEPSFPMDCF
jgi:hypothetical protein